MSLSEGMKLLEAAARELVNRLCFDDFASKYVIDPARTMLPRLVADGAVAPIDMNYPGKEKDLSKITYREWLKQELKRMSPTGTLRLSSLIREATDDNPRMRERVVLYALATKRGIPPATPFYSEYQDVRAVLEGYAGEGLPTGLSDLPMRYRKAINSWVHRKNLAGNIAESRTLRFEANLRLREITRTPVAVIARELGISKGNLNSYFKDEDPTRLSLEKATCVMRYLKEVERGQKR